MNALLPLLFLLPTPANGGDAVSEPVARVYDLSGLFVAADHGHFGDQAFPLLTAEREDESEWERHVDRDLPRAILRELLAEDFEAKGVEVEDAGDERLIVRAAPEVHERVQAAMAALDRTLSATLELELCVIEVPEASDLRAGVVSSAQAQAWIDAAEGAGVLERMLLHVGRGTVSAVDVGHQSSFLADYDVEVAEGALCFDPQMFPLYLGTRVTARASRGKDGHFVALSMRRASAIGELRSSILQRFSAVLAGDSLDTITRRMAHESQPVLGRSFALNAFLPDEGALVALLEHGPSGTREAVLVRAVAGGLQTPRALPGGSREVQLLDVTHWSPPVAVGGVRDAFGEGTRLPHPHSHSWAIRVATAAWGGDEVDTLWRALDLTHSERDVDEGEWPVRAVSLGEQAPRLLQELEAFAPTGANLTAELVLRRGDRIVARFESPLRVGVTSDVVLCSEDLYVFDAVVEIAKYSTVEDPILREAYEGLFASLRPLRTPSGAILLDLRAAGAVPAGARRTLETGDGSSSRLEDQPHDYLLADELLRFDAGRGTSTVRVGDAAGGLALDVTLSAD